MLTGKRAFKGEDVSDVLASVLAREPDWNALPADLPASIRTLYRSRRPRRFALLQLEFMPGPTDSPDVVCAEHTSAAAYEAGQGGYHELEDVFGSFASRRTRDHVNRRLR